jgi:hypothetical protein
MCIFILIIFISGGILIFHDRYYDNEHIKDGDMFHPIRIKQEILDRFLGGFSILFNNCRYLHAFTMYVCMYTCI